MTVHFCRSQADIAAVVRNRRYALGLSYRTVDFLSGVADGYTTKVENGIKSFGVMSLTCILPVLGLRWLVAGNVLIVVEDDEAIPVATRPYIGTRNRSSHNVFAKHVPSTAAVAAARAA